MRVYAAAVKRRERLIGAERKAFDEAVEWAQMGTSEPIDVSEALEAPGSEHEKGPALQGLR